MAWLTNPTIVPGTAATAAEGNAWSNNLNLLAEFFSIYSHGPAMAGSPPATGSATFLLQGGLNSVTFSAGGGTLVFPTAFPNGLLCITGNFFDTAPGNGDTLQVGSPFASQVGLYGKIGGSVASGSYLVSWIAIGF